MARMGSQAVEKAGPAENGPKSDLQGRSQALESRDAVQLAVAKLYGRGVTRTEIVRTLGKRLIPFADPATLADPKKMERAGRQKLRLWEQDQKFRDLVYQHAVVKMDMAIPDVLKGVTRAAKRGRVDAAKLVLEVAGRHSSHENATVTAVQVNVVNGIPRPEARP